MSYEIDPQDTFTDDLQTAIDDSDIDYGSPQENTYTLEDGSTITLDGDGTILEYYDKDGKSVAGMDGQTVKVPGGPGGGVQVPGLWDKIVGLIPKKTDGNIDWTKAIGIAGLTAAGVAGLKNIFDNANKPPPTSGYQKGIPELVFNRRLVAPNMDRRPGSAQDLNFTGGVFTKPEDAAGMDAALGLHAINMAKMRSAPRDSSIASGNVAPRGGANSTLGGTGNGPAEADVMGGIASLPAGEILTGSSTNEMRSNIAPAGGIAAAKPKNTSLVAGNEDLSPEQIQMLTQNNAQGKYNVNGTWVSAPSQAAAESMVTQNSAQNQPLATALSPYAYASTNFDDASLVTKFRPFEGETVAEYQSRLRNGGKGSGTLSSKASAWDDPAVAEWAQARMAQVQGMAAGGIAGIFAKGGPTKPRYLRGETDGMADEVKARIDGGQEARLAHGEFVVPADVVSHLGNGNSDAGAKKLYSMMDKIRVARTGRKQQGKQINPDKFMPKFAEGGIVNFSTGGPTDADMQTFASLIKTGQYDPAAQLARGFGYSNTDIADYIRAAGLTDANNQPISYEQALGFLNSNPAPAPWTPPAPTPWTPPATTTAVTNPYGTPAATEAQKQQFADLILAGNYQAAADLGRSAGYSDAEIAQHVDNADLRDPNGTVQDGQALSWLTANPAGSGTNLTGTGGTSWTPPVNTTPATGWTTTTYGGGGAGTPALTTNPPGYNPGIAGDTSASPTRSTDNPVNREYSGTFTNTGLNPMNAGADAQSSLATWAGPYVTNMLGQGNAIGNDMIANPENYIYQGERTAGISSLQGQAYGNAASLGPNAGLAAATNRAGTLANQAAGMGSSYTPTAFGNQYTATGPYQAQTAGNQYTATGPYQGATFKETEFNQQNLQPYMNPYLQMSLTPQVDEARRNADIQRITNAGRLVGSGAFGGGRQAIMEAEGDRNLQANLAGIIGRGYDTAYTGARDQFNTSANSALANKQATEASRQFGANMGLSNAQNLANYGQQAAGLSQADRQFGANQALSNAQNLANYGQQAANATEASNQFGSRFGLDALSAALSANNQQGQLGIAQGTDARANIGLQANLGDQQRAIQQAGLTSDMNKFNEEAALPGQAIKFKQGLLQGMPITNTAAVHPQTSMMTQLMQLGLTGAEISRMLGLSGTTTGK